MTVDKRDLQVDRVSGGQESLVTQNGHVHSAVLVTRPGPQLVWDCWLAFYTQSLTLDGQIRYVCETPCVSSGGHRD